MFSQNMPSCIKSGYDNGRKTSREPKIGKLNIIEKKGDTNNKPNVYVAYAALKLFPF